MTSLNIRPSECTFIVKKEDRKVICIIPNTIYAFYNFTWMNGFECSREYRMPPSFKGIATCAETDEWNEELGRRIAFLRAKEKMAKSFFNQANHYINDLDEMIEKQANIINNYGARVSKNLNNLREKIEDGLAKNNKENE